jgi:hypothetical protein
MSFDLLHLGKTISQPKLLNGVALRYWNEIFIENCDFSELSNASKPFRCTETHITA